MACQASIDSLSSIHSPVDRANRMEMHFKTKRRGKGSDNPLYGRRSRLQPEGCSSAEYCARGLAQVCHRIRLVRDWVRCGKRKGARTPGYSVVEKTGRLRTLKIEVSEQGQQQ